LHGCWYFGCWIEECKVTVGIGVGVSGSAAWFSILLVFVCLFVGVLFVCWGVVVGLLSILISCECCVDRKIPTYETLRNDGWNR